MTPLRTRPRILPASLLLTAFAALALLTTCPKTVLCIDKPYNVSSDYLMLDIDKKILYANSQTEITYKLLRIQADLIRIDVKTDVVYAEGNVSITSNAKSESLTATAATSKTDAEIAREESDTLDEKIENEKEGYVKTLQGDKLIFDLGRMSGTLTITRREIRRIFLHGETLEEISYSPAISDVKYLFDEPDIEANAITASRFRISPDSNYEAWKSSLWLKGNRMVNLPYYTNNNKGITRNKGTLRLRSISYSSNTNWSIGAAVKYRETRSKNGIVNINYAGKGDQQFTVNSSQQFTLGKVTSGNIGWGNIGTSSQSISASLNHNSKNSSSQNLNLNYSPTGYRYLQVGSNSRIGGSYLQSYMRFNKDGSGDNSTGSIAGTMNLGTPTRFIGGTKGPRDYGYRFTSTVDFNNRNYSDATTNAFVGISTFRSSIKITERLRLNTSLNSGMGISSEGTSRYNTSGSLSFSRPLSRTNSINVSYRYSHGRSAGSSSMSNTITPSISLASPSKWTTRMGTSFNMRTGDIQDASFYASYDFSKKFGIWSDLIYNIEGNRFSVKNFSCRSTVYGTALTTNWFVESNDFVFNINTKFN